MKVKGTTATLFIIVVFAIQCMACYGKETETLQPNEEIRVDLFIVQTNVGIKFVKNLFLFFNYSSDIDMSLPAFQGFRTASYAIGPETPEATECVSAFTISYDSKADDSKVNDAANTILDYFNHSSLNELSRYGNDTTATYTITYGHLPKLPRTYAGRTCPSGGFAELLNSYMQDYKENIKGANYYLDKQGNFEVWYQAVVEEILTSEKVYEGTREVRLDSLFDIESVRASNQNKSVIIFATYGDTDYLTTAKEITPIPTITEDHTTYSNLPQMWYIWRVRPNQMVDITFTVQLTANKPNNSYGYVGVMIILLTISLLIFLGLRMRRKLRRH